MHLTNLIEEINIVHNEDGTTRLAFPRIARTHELPRRLQSEFAERKSKLGTYLTWSEPTPTGERGEIAYRIEVGTYLIFVYETIE